MVKTLFIMGIDNQKINYSDDSVKSLDWKEHIRLRPGMYIGKLGDGSSFDDGVYVLLKEIIDNCIDEHLMGHGKTINITIEENLIAARDYGRGIPLGKVIDCVSKINTGAKYDSGAFTKTVGLNGVGTKAVNALSSYFKVQSFRDGETKIAVFSKGKIKENLPLEPTKETNGTLIIFKPDEQLFGDYHYVQEYIDKLLWNYAYLNAGLRITFNEHEYYSEKGLLDLLNHNISEEIVYPIIQLKTEDLEIVFTHTKSYGEDYYSFVNGQHTTQGGTHEIALREAFTKVIRDFYKKDFEPADIRQSIVAAIAIRVHEPVFESQTKTKLGSTVMNQGSDISIKTYVMDLLKSQLDDYLHKNPETSEALLKKILQSEKERKELSGIRKLMKERSKQTSIHNKKLRDCKVHYNTKHVDNLNSTLFLTEGDSASGSITMARDVATQAVFSLRGKPLNCYGLTKKIVYENEEFNFLQNALNIEDGLENLRYNNVVIATDADVDGMHIRLLLMTFFLQFFPDLVRSGHLYVLQTPLFRVRNKKDTIYCYSEQEKQKAIVKLGNKPEITRFKGLGEISPHEFKRFIGNNMRLEPIILKKQDNIKEILEFYMGKNTPTRQSFIIENLKVEEQTDAET